MKNEEYEEITDFIKKIEIFFFNEEYENSE